MPEINYGMWTLMVFIILNAFAGLYAWTQGGIAVAVFQGVVVFALTLLYILSRPIKKAH